MIDINRLFFELIQVAVGRKTCLSRLPSQKEWKQMYDFAKTQSVVGICFAGFQKLGADVDDGYEKIGMSEKLYLVWMGMAFKIQQKNEKVNKQCIALQKKLSNAGLRSSIFKGQGIACAYDEELAKLRQSGDIDVYVDCGRKRTLEYLQSLGMKDQEWDYVHTDAHFFEDTKVEVHYRAGAIRNVFRNRSLQKFWKEHNEDFFSGSAKLSCGDIVCPSDRMHLFYLIHHSYRHLITGGIGLRQVMDLYFALLCRDTSNDKWLKEHVEAFHMTVFAEAMVWVMHDVFCMEKSRFPWNPNEKEGQFLLDEIMISGNFGKGDKRFGEGCSKMDILMRLIRRNWHLASHYGSDALGAPLYYVWHFCWKRLNRMCL